MIVYRVPYRIWLVKTIIFLNQTPGILHCTLRKLVNTMLSELACIIERLASKRLMEYFGSGSVHTPIMIELQVDLSS